MKPVGEEFDWCVVVGSGENFPRIDYGHLRLVGRELEDELVDASDQVGRTIFLRRAGHYLADDRPAWPGWRPRSRSTIRRMLLATIHGLPPASSRSLSADEEHDRARVERDDVLLQVDEHAARGVAADAAVGGLGRGNAPSKSSCQPCVIESPRKTMARWSCCTRVAH